MVIHFRKAKVFEWEVAQTGNGVVGSDLSAANIFEEFAKGLGVHG
jgi:hypothetical protein